MLLIPRIRIIREKLIVFKLLKIFNVFGECEDRALHWAAQKSVSVICPKQNDPLHIFSPNFLML